MNDICCPNCRHQLRSDLDVMTEMLARVMPRRIPSKWDVRELAGEALAVARALGYVKVPTNPAMTGARP